MQKDDHSGGLQRVDATGWRDLRLTVDGTLRPAEATHHLSALPIVAFVWKE